MEPRDNMLVDLVDDEDHVVGRARRDHALASEHGFRVAHIFLFNRSGELLIQQLALERERNPGYWGSSVAAVVRAGESYRGAARRRLDEELGLNDVALEEVGKTAFVETNHHPKFITLFKGRCEQLDHWDPHHIAALEWVSLERVMKMVQYDERPFTPTFKAALEFYTNG